MEKVFELFISKFLLFVVVSSWTDKTTASSYSGCSQGSQRVVSYDHSLISPQNISASAQETSFNPDDHLFHKYNSPLRMWCTEMLMGGKQNSSSSEVYLRDLPGGPITINVTFTTPLLLTHIITSGFIKDYVKTFTIQQSTALEGPFLPYNQSGVEHIFQASQQDMVITLDPPINARKIRFDILDGLLTPNARMCWHLALLGCTLDQAIAQTSEVLPNQSLIPQCTTVGITPAASSSVSSPSHTSCIMTTVIETITASTTICTSSPVPSPTTTSCAMATHTETVTVIAAFLTTSSEPFTNPATTDYNTAVALPMPTATPLPSLPSTCSSTVTETIVIGIVSCSVTPSESPAPTNPLTHTNGSDDAAAMETSCQRYHLILYVVPSVAVGLLLLACLSFACICACLHCKCKVERRDHRKGVSVTMLDNELYESREQVRHFPKDGEDTLGMVDNELYKTRGSVLPASVLHARHVPAINGNGISGIPRGSANGAAANRSNEVLYENCGSFFNSSKRSTLCDSMNPRSTVTTDIEQSVKSVDSMVDNPTYSVPFPVDYHAVSIFPQKKNHPHGFPMTSLTKEVSSIDMVDNECYCMPSSLSGRDDEMEQSLVTGQAFPPMEYETPK